MDVQFLDKCSMLHSPVEFTQYASRKFRQRLWRYGLTAFKLLSRPGVYDAFCTLLREDVTVSVQTESLFADKGMTERDVYKWLQEKLTE